MTLRSWNRLNRTGQQQRAADGLRMTTVKAIQLLLLHSQNRPARTCHEQKQALQKLRQTATGETGTTAASVNQTGRAHCRRLQDFQTTAGAAAATVHHREGVTPARSLAMVRRHPGPSRRNSGIVGGGLLSPRNPIGVVHRHIGDRRHRAGGRNHHGGSGLRGTDSQQGTAHHS